MISGESKKAYAEKSILIINDYINKIPLSLIYKKYNILWNHLYTILRNNKIKRNRRGIDIKERLFEKIEKTNTCWIWKGCLIESGYGTIGYKGKNFVVHRLMYELFVAKIPEGMLACHICDNKLCCNPSHIFLGTHKDNLVDMVNKKRSNFGEKHHNARLKTEEAREIKFSKEKNTILSDRFKVSAGHIDNIRLGIRWKHLTRMVKNE